MGLLTLSSGGQAVSWWLDGFCLGCRGSFPCVHLSASSLVLICAVVTGFQMQWETNSPCTSTFKALFSLFVNVIQSH